MNKLCFFIIIFLIIIYSLFAEDYNYIDLFKLTDLICIHTTYENIDGYKTPSNGLIIDSKEGLILIDTPWNNAQTETLLKLTKEKFKKDIILVIITHFHQDRLGGIEIIHKNNIETISTELTVNLVEKTGYPKPKKRLSNDITLFNYNNIKFETYFPGAAHTLDNIIVWFPEDKILFGGCMLKSEDSNNLGNTKDSDLKQWPKSLENLIKKYPDINITVPGHGNWSKNNLIKHTLNLFKKDK